MKMLAIVLFLISSSLASFSCLDGSGSPVDSFVAIKQPNGYKYQLYSGGSFEDAGSLDTGTGPVGNTLKSLFQCTGSGCAYALYNDQTPDEKQHDSNAHMKGALAFDGTSGFWLVHSVPKFPNYVSSGYTFPETETKYGQSFLCITLDTATFDVIGGAFMIDYPFVYDHSLPSGLQGMVPRLAAFLGGKHVTASATNVSSILSSGGTRYDVFAKNKAWASELYEDLVAPYYATGLSVETWQNGVGKLPSYCTPQYGYDVVNVQSVAFPDGTTWKETDDHSKWAVSQIGNFVCIGDINRVSGQFKRGGGTVCQSDAQLWSAFSGLIATSESC